MTTRSPEEYELTIQAAPKASDVAVIICAYTQERWDDIVEAIDSVRNQTAQPSEIVLVVDHNEDLLAQAREQYSDKGSSDSKSSNDANLNDANSNDAKVNTKVKVQVVQNRHRQGLSGARNTGIESSSAPIVAFLDDDAFAKPGWLEGMLPPYQDQDVIGIGGFIDPVWLTARPKWWPREFDWVVGCSYKGLPTKTAPIRNPIGANMSVRRVAFESVGGFSHAIGRVGKRPVGCEETEFYIRVHQRWPEAGIVYEPKSAVGHKVPGARANFKYFRARCYAEGLSKAIVAKLVGTDDGLSSERDYTLKTLPLGVLRGLKDGFTGDLNGFRRAGAIIAGLAFTTAGFLRGRMASGPERSLVEVPSSRRVK